ncbi:class I SAM-dependent methyltransferase [Streptomyces sp. NPDC046977]|uniref:class I SAM-dependent methyltransferase n=1 Tax=Streptomyces sp. NPDC046977 TaxID=3154703 RepID=UPI0033E59DFC
MSGTTTTAAAGWQAWQDSWDRQQEWYLPDREERFRVMLDMVEALVGPEPRVLDLACGTGSISDRLLRRFPGATSTGVDLDPALLTIARGYFAGERRVEFVTADLRDPQWPARLPHGRYDAVLTATALHWLKPGPLGALYGTLAGLLRDGGVLMNADHMPDASTPRLNAAVRALDHARRDREQAAGALDWEQWWATAKADPLLAGPVEERWAIYGSHADGDELPPSWHVEALREAGFGEAREIWRSATDAIVLGLR